MPVYNKKDIPLILTEMEQYAESDEYYAPLLEKASPYIGEILIAFSELEYTLELAITGIQSERGDEPGMFIVKFLETNKLKIDFFSESARPFIHYADHIREKDKAKLYAEIRLLAILLRDIGEIRNIIAHSKWATMSHEGYVRNAIRLNKHTGRIELQAYKLNPAMLRSILAGIKSIDRKMCSFIEKANIR